MYIADTLPYSKTQITHNIEYSTISALFCNFITIFDIR
jgi:hypothetical protein